MNKPDLLTGAALPTSAPQPTTVHLLKGDLGDIPRAHRAVAEKKERTDSMATIKERILTVLKEATAPIKRQDLASAAKVGDQTLSVTVPAMKRAGQIVSHKGRYVLAGREALFEVADSNHSSKPVKKRGAGRRSSQKSNAPAFEPGEQQEIDKPANTDYVLAQMAAHHPSELSTARIAQLCSDLSRTAVEKSLFKLMSRKDAPIERVRAGVYRSLLDADQARNLRPRIKPVIGFKGFDAAIHSDGCLAITAGPNAANTQTIRLNRQQSLALARFIREAETFFPE